MKTMLLISLLSVLTLTGGKKGTGSIYHDKYSGRLTASGDVFSQNKLTAASNIFKLGTKVKVTNERNGKSVEVLINDRMAKGIEKRGRIIDLSRAAAKEIDFTLKQGLTPVSVIEI